MIIQQYLKKIDGDRKVFVVLVVTPKGKYPIDINDETYWEFADNILLNPSHYIGIFENERPEMMQEVAFTLFTKPHIADKYSLRTRVTNHVPRANHEKIEAFWVAKSFYEHVPSGELSEEESIEKGLDLAKEFLLKYPIEEHEFVITDIDRHDTGSNILVDIQFNNSTFAHQ